MFGKWFKKKTLPTNVGKSEPSRTQKSHRPKIYELELSNMEDSPVYSLSHQISIGSEMGNIVIADPSISPKHATFFVQDEVVFIMDHGSVSGTFIKGKKIDPGKKILLEDNDLITLGDLEVKLTSRRAPVQIEELPELPTDITEATPQLNPETEVKTNSDLKLNSREIDKLDSNAPSLVGLDLNENTGSHNIGEKEIQNKVEEKTNSKINPPEATSKKSFVPDYHEPTGSHPSLLEKLNNKKNEKKKKKNNFFLSKPVYSANAIMRVFAVILDLLVSYSILIIFSPFEVFNEILGFIPELLATELDIDWKALWVAFIEDYNFIQEIINDVTTLVPLSFNFISLLLVYVLLRFFSTIIFGVSLSEYFIGIRPTGNKIWSRIGGVIRVVVGIFTWPFIIFDIPAVVSRRTLKEFITFTNIHTPSVLKCIFSFIFYVPLVLGLTLISPMFEGLEPPAPIAVNEMIERKAAPKKIEADSNFAESETTISEPEEIKLKDSSNNLKLSLEYSPKMAQIIPKLSLRGVKQSAEVTSGIILYHRQEKIILEFEVFKRFDLKELLSIAFKGNIFLFEKYPQLHDYVYQPNGLNPALRKKKDETQSEKFSKELVEFTRMSFSVSFENFTQIMEEKTPLIKGLIDYKNAFLKILDTKNLDQIQVVKIGNGRFFKISFDKQKPFDLLIPLNADGGKVFKLSFENKEDYLKKSHLFYKEIFSTADWINSIPVTTNIEVMSSLEIFDAWSTYNFTNSFLTSPEKAQKLYGHYFEASSLILQENNSHLLTIWKNQLSNILKLISLLPEPKVTNEEENPEQLKKKLHQNFTDLLNAIENNDLNFFGASQATNV